VATLSTLWERGGRYGKAKGEEEEDRCGGYQGMHWFEQKGSSGVALEGVCETYISLEIYRVEEKEAIRGKMRSVVQKFRGGQEHACDRQKIWGCET